MLTVLPGTTGAGRVVRSKGRARTRAPAPSSLPPALLVGVVTPRWTARGVTWLALVTASLASLAVLWSLSWSGAEDAVVQALSDQLRVQARLAAAHLDEVPMATLSSLGAGHASEVVETELGELSSASGLHDLAVIGPNDQVFGSGGSWLPLEADRDLLARARAGEDVVGPLYRGPDAVPYLAAYAPLPSQPGWAVAVEGSATLGAVDSLAGRQALASVLVLLVVGLVGGLIAHRIARPLRQLRADLRSVHPGDDPEELPLQGPMEVHDVALAARGLLHAIRERDVQVRQAHDHELEQLTRLAAGVAHEIRNPLNAMALSVGRLPRLDDPEARGRVATRLSGQLQELEAIVARLVDLTRPLEPSLADVDLTVLVERVGADVEAEVVVEGAATAHTDANLVAEVLRNLLLNAQQAGAGRVVVRVSDTVLEVEDDGPGIDDPEGLFAWFHTTRAQGSGLGLPVSRRIAEALGGSLTLAQQRPTTFRLTLGSSS